MPAWNFTAWNFAAVWETVAEVRADAIAQRCGVRTLTWSDFDGRASGIARAMLDAGISHQGKVALYLYNCPEFMEAAFAAMKAGLVPVNTNYRYRERELEYLWQNADVEAVVFHGSFAPTIEALRERFARVRLWLWVSDGDDRCPPWAIALEDAAARGTRVRSHEHAADEDEILIYTGGTTGMPKGVIWRQHDLYMASNTTGDPEQASSEHVRERVRTAERFPTGLSAAPLMHGTGFVFATTVLSRGGTLVTLEEHAFDAGRVLDAIARDRVTDLCIVGDAFARPIVDRLDESPGRWNIESLRTVSSSGMVWSAEVKERLLAHAPQLLLVDFLNSSEASGMGRSVASARAPRGSSGFKPGRRTVVIDENGEPIAPGSERIGRVAVTGHIPMGYYKDPGKTAVTFPVIGGVRHAIPGDHARVADDGSIVFVGRGSTSINTGGEKVFPEEVEDRIRSLPGVRDALVVGLPDARFGQVVAAAVELEPGADASPEDIRMHVRAGLARYKAPSHVLIVDRVDRTVSGKPDYRATRWRIGRWLGIDDTQAGEARNDAAG